MICKNWKEYVGFQDCELNEVGTFATAFVVSAEQDNNGDTRLSVIKHYIPLADFTLEEEQVSGVVEKLLQTFPRKIIENDLDVHRSSIEVAKTCRRGLANMYWNNVWYYKGANYMDSPIFVCLYQGKYYVFLHPDFAKYGFVGVSNEADL